MPQKCSIPREDAINILTQNIEHFKTATLPKYSSQVWKDLAKECNGVWSHLSWWVNVTKNRREILSLARERMGIEIDEPQDKKRNHDSSFTDSDISFHGSDSEGDQEESWFNLILKQEQWECMKPSSEDSDGKKIRLVLKPYAWTNIIADEFYRQHKLPCPFSFIRNEISTSLKKTHYLKIEGYCRYETCTNKFYGYLDKEPLSTDETIVIRVKTRNTTREDHGDTKRFLTADKRRALGKQSHAEGCSNLLKRLKRENIGRGETEGPILPTADVLRHAQHEHVNRELGIEKTGEDYVQKIYNLQFVRPYMGSIDAVGYNPFYVFYGLPEQITLYQQYCSVMKDWSCVSIDGTGSLVKKIVRPLGLQSNHIFLHCVVIHFNKEIVSIFQMLAESQESETFTHWLQRWLNLVRIKPKQCVIDYSRALLTGCSKAFNNMKIKDYIDLYFSFLRDGDVNILGAISTYIRIDVAHLIHLICRWKATNDITRFVIREFFIRCAALMVDCQYLHQFEEIFMLTCIVGSHLHEDTVLRSNIVATVIDAREKLEEYIITRKIDVAELSKLDEKEGESDEDSLDDDGEMPIASDAKNYIEKIFDQAKEVLQEGEILNPFYVPEFIKQLVRIAREFILWTGVGIPFFDKHASSSHSEKNFQDLKGKMLKQFSNGLGTEKFLKLHIKDVLGSTRSVASKLTQFTVQGGNLPDIQHKTYQVCHKEPASRNGKENSQFENSGPVNCSKSQHEDSDLLARENWGGKAGRGIFDQYSDESSADEEITVRNKHTAMEEDFEDQAESNDRVRSHQNSKKNMEQIKRKFLCNYCSEIIETASLSSHECSQDPLLHRTRDKDVKSPLKKSGLPEFDFGIKFSIFNKKKNP